MKARWLKYLGIFVCVFVICTAILCGVWKAWFDPGRGTVKVLEQSEQLESVLTGAQAVEELDYIANRLRERHPACVQGLPEAVQDAYKRERAELLVSESVTVMSLWQSAARILSNLGDAHTVVRPYYHDIISLPLSFSWNDEHLVCLGGEYDGDTVVKIDGIPVHVLYRRFQKQFSYELDSWVRYAFASRINRRDYLAFVGVNTNQEIQVLLKRKDSDCFLSKEFLLRKQPDNKIGESEPFFDYMTDETSGVGIFTLRQCNYDVAYRTALKDFFTSVQEKDISNVILDLRDNPGGNSLVADEFLRYLPVKKYQSGSSEVRFGPILWKNQPFAKKNRQAEPTFSGEVYVLTSTNSFSSAMDFATLLSDNGLCTVVGEIPGNMPSSYGDILYFQTPIARLVFTVSYKRFIRPDPSKSDMPLIPDVQVSADDAMKETIELIRKNLK
jgi:hypothetical protein